MLKRADLVASKDQLLGLGKRRKIAGLKVPAVDLRLDFIRSITLKILNELRDLVNSRPLMPVTEYNHGEDAE